MSTLPRYPIILIVRLYVLAPFPEVTKLTPQKG